MPDETTKKTRHEGALFPCDNCGQYGILESGLAVLHCKHVTAYLCKDCCITPAAKIVLRRDEEENLLRFDAYQPFRG